MPRAPYHLDAIKTALHEQGELQQAALCKAVDLKASTLIAALKPGLRSGEIVERREGRSAFYRLADGAQAEPAAEKPPEFNAALWADGDLVLVGVALNADGHSITLSPDRVRLLCRLLHGQGPAVAEPVGHRRSRR